MNPFKPYSLTSHKAWEIQDKSSVAKLDWNESDISPSPRVKESLIDFISHYPLNWYPDANNDELLKQLSNYASINVQCVQYFNGSDGAHEYIVKVMCRSGDAVIMVGPTYDNFRIVVESNDLKINFFNVSEPWENLNVQSLIDRVHSVKASLVYLCNPNNPTGMMVSIKDIEMLLKATPHCHYLVDEAYYEFGKNSAAELIKKYKNLIITRTFSKAFGLASLRMGYVLSDSENIEKINLVRNAKSVSMPAQVAALAALKDIDYMNEYVEKIDQSKSFLIKCIQDKYKDKLQIYAGYGNFVFIKIIQGNKDQLITLLKAQNVFIRDFKHIEGFSEFVRITLGTMKKMEQLEAILSCYYFPK